MAHAGIGEAVEGLRSAAVSARECLMAHPVYADLGNLAAIRTFLEHHVFAVWESMSLLKSLPRELRRVLTPWLPTAPTAIRRPINDMALAEDSDEPGGGYSRHFELYVAAMAEAGAGRSIVDRFRHLLHVGNSAPDALGGAGVPRPSARFVGSTWELTKSGRLHCRVAAIAFGRENFFPDIFARVVAVNHDAGGLNTFLEYLERHIQLDGAHHSPMAMEMLVDLCGDDEGKWRECAQAAKAAVAARFQLWDGILAAIKCGTVERDPWLRASAEWISGE